LVAQGDPDKSDVLELQDRAVVCPDEVPTLVKEVVHSFDPTQNVVRKSVLYSATEDATPFPEALIQRGGRSADVKSVHLPMRISETASHIKKRPVKGDAQ